MKLLYAQNNTQSSIAQSGFKNCYLKSFTIDENGDTYIKKCHSHNSYEIHMIIDGCMVYEIGNKAVTVGSKECLIIPPKVPHKIVFCASKTLKVSLCFEFEYSPASDFINLSNLKTPSVVPIPNRILENLQFINHQFKKRSSLSVLMIENSILETIILLLNRFEILESTDNKLSKPSPVLRMAKQFIKDNIYMAPTIHDVSLYCHISARQLTRIFIENEGMSAFDYIRNQRLEIIKRLLCDTKLSLKQISEQMNFPDEYYFNTYFKNNCDISPSAYRKRNF